MSTLHCVVPGNFCTHLKEGNWRLLEGGVSKPKVRKNSNNEAKLEFPDSRGLNLQWKTMKYFLKQQIQ